jgi:hypothetical protein
VNFPGTRLELFLEVLEKTRTNPSQTNECPSRDISRDAAAADLLSSSLPPWSSREAVKSGINTDKEREREAVDKRIDTGD